jgi:hypothetical protein
MSRKTTKGSSSSEVGRGKPPKAHQFKPGQSGNPGGRKKGSLNTNTVLKRVLESEMDLTENGQKRRRVGGSVFEAAAVRDPRRLARW